MLNELIIPASALEVVKHYEGSSNQLGYFLKNQVWLPDYPPQVAILGVPEGRGSLCRQIADGPDAIRRNLYTLASFSSDVTIFDLGNLKCGTELKDTYAALKMVSEELSLMNIRLLILGGSQELAVPLILGFNKEEFDLVIVDDRIDNSENDDSPSDERYINNLPVGTSVSVIAVQSYFVGEQMYNLPADGSDSEILTLGEMRADIKELEPLLRKANFVSFDFGAMKLSEAPGQCRISPNGLTGEEACQTAWYTGISTTPSWFGLFGYSPQLDPATSGAMMAAQISWYFINGVSKRMDEEPQDEATNFEHFHISIDGLEDPVSFLMHPLSRRWWMEVPSEDCTLYPVRIPCSKKDYRKACENEISEKWWKYFNRI